MKPSAYQKIFVEPDEQLLGTLGNGYLESMLNKKVKKCHALLTDKRVYFQGTFFDGRGKTLQQDIIEKIVDLEDITGTGFRYNKPFRILTTVIMLVIWWLLIISFGYYYSPVGLFGTIITILITIIKYIKSRKTDFMLEYAGGAIRFNASIIGLSHVKDFNMQIRRAKDHAKAKGEY